MKKVSKIRTGIFITMMLFGLAGVGVQAAEDVQKTRTEETAEQVRFVKDTVWEAVDEVKVREEPDSKSKTIGELEAGTPVVVSEDEKDGWCKVRNQAVEGYVQTSDLQIVNAANAEALNQEFGVNEEFDSMVLEEYDYQQRQRRTSIIWGVVIGVLVIAIFAVGIVSAIHSNKAEQSEDNEKEEGKTEQVEKAGQEEVMQEKKNDQKRTDIGEMNIEEIGEDDQ